MNRMTARVCAGICGGVLLATVTSGCTNSEKEAPTTTPSSSSVSVTPTEKSLNPTEGNKFTPGVKAPPAPTAIPGSH